MAITESQKLKLLEAAFLQSFSSIVITDADLAHGGPRIVLCNDAFCKMTGYERSELIGHNPKMLQGPLTDRQLIKQLRQCLVSGEFFHGRTTNYRKDGTPYVVEWNISAIRDEGGAITHYVSVQSNLSKLVKAERERAILSKALQEARDCVMVTDETGHILFVNRGFERLTGYAADEVIGKEPFFIHAKEEEAAAQSNTGNISGNQSVTDAYRHYVTMTKKDGTLAYLIKDVSTVMADDGLSSSDVCIAKDVTEQVKHRKRLERLAQTDQLTGLLNRHAGDAVLEEVQGQAETSDVPFSIILCDIDHFKRVNDRFGHLAGDSVLIQISTLLKNIVRGTDFCIRWGGEEFMIVLPGCPVLAAFKLAERIRMQLHQLEDELVGHFTMSFGVGEWSPGESQETLINRIDQALYEAKHAGRDRVILSPTPTRQAFHY